MLGELRMNSPDDRPKVRCSAASHICWLGCSMVQQKTGCTRDRCLADASIASDKRLTPRCVIGLPNGLERLLTSVEEFFRINGGRGPQMTCENLCEFVFGEAVQCHLS